MFLRGRPITMYVPSGHVGFRPELPPERLQLDWVYPLPQHRGGGGSHVAPHCHPICYGLRRGGDGPSLNLPPSPITSYPFREGPTNTTGRMEGTTS